MILSLYPIKTHKLKGHTHHTIWFSSNEDRGEIQKGGMGQIGAWSLPSPLPVFLSTVAWSLPHCQRHAAEMGQLGFFFFLVMISLLGSFVKLCKIGLILLILCLDYQMLKWVVVVDRWLLGGALFVFGWYFLDRCWSVTEERRREKGKVYWWWVFRYFQYCNGNNTKRAERVFIYGPSGVHKPFRVFP